MKFFFIIILFLFSCRTRIHDKKLGIELKIEQSISIDLNKGVYIVYFISKPVTEIHFSLSPKEFLDIVNYYYDQGLNELPGNTVISDECTYMPKIYTTLKTISASQTQSIKIDEQCNNYSFFGNSKAKKVKNFIMFVMNILNSKPGIKDAPKSDIPYL